MRNFLFSREVKIYLQTIVFCALGFFAIWIAKNHISLKSEESVFIAFLILPIVIYMIVAGRLLEVKAFGAEAKFADIAKQSVEATSETIEPSMEDTNIVAKGGIREMQKMKASLDETKPILLTLVLGKHHYDKQAMEKYVETFAQCYTFKGIVILNSDGRFAVYFPPKSITAILRSSDGDLFISDINEQKVDRLKRYPGCITQTLTKKSTNVEALNEMTIQNVDSLVVLNDENKLNGVVERQQLISKLLLAMVK